MGGSLAGALAFAVSAGLATFFAPCAFPLLPGYVGYYLGQRRGVDASLPAALAAATGAVLALAAVSGLALAFGRRVTATLPLLEPVVGGGLVAFGLLVLSGRGPELDVPLPERPESVVGFGVFGAVYAVAAAGCVVPLFLGVLAQALALAVVPATVVLAGYALAVATPLVGVTLLAGAGVESWRSLGRYTHRIQQVAAVAMVAAGLGQVYLSVAVLDVL